LLPVKPGSATKPLAGWDVCVLDDDAQPVKAGAITLAGKLPLPPVRRPPVQAARYEQAHSRRSGYYKTGDVVISTRMVRTHPDRRCTMLHVFDRAIEVLPSPDVAECAVTGVADRQGSAAGVPALKAVNRESGELSAACGAWLIGLFVLQDRDRRQALPRRVPARSCAASCRRSQTRRA
jgi:propionyl-CoA synthetase